MMWYTIYWHEKYFCIEQCNNCMNKAWLLNYSLCLFLLLICKLKADQWIHSCERRNSGQVEGGNQWFWTNWQKLSSLLARPKRLTPWCCCCKRQWWCQECKSFNYLGLAGFIGTDIFVSLILLHVWSRLHTCWNMILCWEHLKQMWRY